MKKDFPFLFKTLLVFLLLDGLEKILFLFQRIFYTSGVSFVNSISLLFLIVACFNFLLATQLYFRIQLTRIWITLFLFLNMTYQVLFFTIISPQDWLMLSEYGRILQLFTVALNIAILWYAHSNECKLILDQ